MKISPERKNEIKTWLNSIDIEINDLDIYILALTHRSYFNQNNSSSRGNEQLEFLGDSVLSFVITSYLYKNYGHFSEGRLTKIRASLINSHALSGFAVDINLNNYIILSSNEELLNGREKESILEDSMEALIGAVYIDRGIKYLNKWLLEQYGKNIEDAIKNPKVFDFKTHLQETIQSGNLGEIKYTVIDEKGPAHDKTFYSAVMLNDTIIGKGRGKSIKDSEQKAAEKALKDYFKIKI